MKIDLPKQEWVSSLMMDFAKGGFFHNRNMLHLTFTGNECPDPETMTSVLELILGALPKLPKVKIIRFSGLFSPSDLLMEAFVRSLTDYGMEVQIVLRETMPPPWWRRGWTILQTGKTTVPFAVSEVWYTPPLAPDATSIPDIVRMPRNGANTMLYLGGGLSVKVVVDFMAKSEWSWALL